MSNNNNQPPPWSEAPTWATWRAQDRNGAWFWYSEKPTPNDGFFHTDGKISMCKMTSVNTNWLYTLQKRPENE